MILLSIRDLKSTTFDAPFPSQTVGTACRQIRAAASGPESMLNKYPEDFELYVVASFDATTGNVVGQAPEFVANLAVITGKVEAKADDVPHSV